MPTQSRPAEKHVYRLALYGVRSSGKTCILSALTLPRVAHPKSYSCSWIEDVPGRSPPPGDSSSEDPFHVGWRWLREQRDRLKRGELPQPNPNRDMMRFWFDFGSRDQGLRRIELIDYSGELLTANASELAQTLREHMRICDGLLLLAEAPYPGRDLVPLSEDFEALKGAFCLLLGERDSGPQQEWPITIMFNKWDRRGELDHQHPEQESEQLDQFLHQFPPPPHASLIDAVTNAVGEDNVQCIPVSAFGTHVVNREGAEVPLPNGSLLKSFQLEDGFIWVADRSDALRVEQLEEASVAASWWAFPQSFVGASTSSPTAKASAWSRWFRGISAVSGISTAWALLRRLPRESKLHARTKVALRQFAFKLTSQLTLCLATLLALLIGIETVADGVQYRSNIAIRDNPAATTQQLETAEAWLQGYFQSPSYRHWLSCLMTVDRTASHRMLVDLRIRRDDAMWKTVTDVENPQTKVILARKYLAVFPTGQHASQAATLVAGDETEKMERANEAFLAQIELKVEAIIPAPTSNFTSQLEQLHSLSEEFQKLPHPEAVSESIVARQQSLQKLINQKQTQIAMTSRQADWNKFQQVYYALIRNKNVTEAAQQLVSRVPHDDGLRELKKHFAKEAPPIIQSKVQGAIKSHSWLSARDSARLRVDPNMILLLTGVENKSLEKLDKEIDEAEDRDLYAQVVRYKPLCGDQLEAYLSRAPLKTMRADIENYKRYVGTMKGTLDLKLSLSAIQWGDKYYSSLYSYKNDITVSAKGVPLISATKILSTANQRSADVGEGILKVGLNETITIDVSIVAKYGTVTTSTMSGGSANWSGTANQLRSGVTLDLNGNSFTNKATFALSGIPPEPPLPAWRGK